MARPRTTRTPARRNSSKRSPASRRGPAPAPRRGPAPAPRHAPSADPERTLARQPWSSLRAFLPGATGDQDRVLARLRAFALELLQWNRGVSNLISHADETRLVERHIAESLAGASVLRELAPKHIVDLGSGGGFPALPLAIAGIGPRWTLVESRRNKTLFLRRALERLELHGIKVMTGRLEVLVDDEHDALQCDGFTSRATMRAGPTLALAARIVRPGGHAVLWKGSGLEQELVEKPADWRSSWSAPRPLPIGAGPNSIAVFKRSA
jgi:16S rRNA (guanine527-N7)-methyltransferase